MPLSGKSAKNNKSYPNGLVKVIRAHWGYKLTARPEGKIPQLETKIFF